MESFQNIEKSIFIGDVHVPYQDHRAVKLMLEFVKWFKPEFVFLIGDIVDFYPVSKYSKNPKRLLSLQAELDSASKFLGEVRAAAPESRIVFMDGNHEDRMRRFLWEHPEISPLKALKLDNLLDLDSHGIEYRKGSFFYRGFRVEHGNIVRKHSAYTARGMLESRGCSGISGHTHRMGVSYYTNLTGAKVWYENGCLCAMGQEYANGATPNWQQGFSVGHWRTESSDGDPITKNLNPNSIDRFFVEQIPIVNHKILYSGKLFTVPEKTAKKTSPSANEKGENMAEYIARLKQKFDAAALKEEPQNNWLDDETWMTRHEMADFFGVSVRTIQRRVLDGMIIRKQFVDGYKYRLSSG